MASGFIRVSFTREFTFLCVRCVWFTDLIRFMVSSGFHSVVSVRSHVSQVHGSLVSLGSHSPGNSLFCVSEVRALRLHHGFIHLWVYFPIFQRCMVYLFPQGFISIEYTFPCVRGTRFSTFFRVSFTSEFTFPSVRGAWFTGFCRVSFTHEFFSSVPDVHNLVVSSGFHSPVSALSCLSAVHCLLVSSVFHLQWVHFPMCQRYTFK